MATRADTLRITLGSTEVIHLAVVGAVPGVVPLLAAGACGVGTGSLRYTAAGLAWLAPGESTWGEDVPATADGEYLLESGESPDAFLRVQVHASHLVAGSEASVILLRVAGNWLDDVTQPEASAGDMEYCTLTLANAGSEAITRVRAWLSDDTDFLEISADAANWYSATTEESGVLVGDLAASATAPLYVRRTIPASTDSQPIVAALIHAAFDGPES